MTVAVDPLVSSKLRPVHMRRRMVARPRLTACLDRGLGYKLTLISAPAGSGKTALLHRWARSRADRGSPVAWISLDAGDNDPVRFLSYLIAANREVGDEDFSAGVLAALRAPAPRRMEALLGAFVNELAALPGETVMILDDYHLIASEDVHRIVSFLLENLPERAPHPLKPCGPTPATRCAPCP